MKKIGVLGMLCMLVLVMTGADVSAKARKKQSEKKKDDKVQELVKEQGTFDVYTDKMSRKNHYIPSGYMGDYGDIKVNDNWKEQPRSGASCIRIEYTEDMTQGAGWAGIYWQNPANNWGTRKGGYDLTGAKKLTFWARGEKGGEFLTEFKIGGITGEYPDSDAVSISDIELTKNWKKYEIDIAEADLTCISGGFCWASNLENNPEGFVIYLDDIIYEFDGKKTPKIEASETEKTEKKIEKPDTGGTLRKKRNKYLDE